MHHGGAATLLPHAGRHLEADAVANLTGHQELLGRRREAQLTIRVVQSIEPDRAIERRAGGGHAHENDVLDEVRHVFAREGALALLDLIDGARHRGAQVELALIGFQHPDLELDVQVAGRLVRVDAVGVAAGTATAGERVVGRARAFGVVAGQQEPAHLRQQVRHRHGVALPVDALPQPLMVQRQSFALDCAQHHRRQAPGADRQPVQPAAGRFSVPQFVVHRQRRPVSTRNFLEKAEIWTAHRLVNGARPTVAI